MNKTKLITWIVTISVLFAWNSIGIFISRWVYAVTVKVGLPLPLVELILFLLPLILLLEVVTKILFVVLAVPPLKIEQIPASSWSDIDRDEINLYTAALERIGFIHLTDYTISSSQGMARLFSHPQKFCFAEVGKVSSLPIFCSVSCQLEQQWSLAVSNLAYTSKPSAISYAFLRAPRNLSQRIEHANAELLFRSLLEWRERACYDFEDVSVESYFDIQCRKRLAQRRNMLRKSITWGLIEMLLFTALHYLICSIDSMLSKKSKQINIISGEILAMIDKRV